MKRKLLLITFMLAAMLFLLSVSAGAITLQEAVDTYEGYFDGKTVESIDTILAAEHINPEIYESYADTAVDARVELSCTCGKTHIYPTYYITKFYDEGESAYDNNTHFLGNSVFHVDFSDINKKNPCGAVYSKDTVVAIEVPNGYKVYDGSSEVSTEATYLCGLRASNSLKFADLTTCTTLIELNGSSFHEAFGDSPELEYVKLPDAINKIPAYAFENCPKLKRVVLSENSQLKSINMRSFVGCTSLEAFYLPECFERMIGGTKSDEGAFTGCTSLYFVNEPNSLEKPNVYYFPQSLVQIENEAIKNCPNMNRVLVFGEKLTKVDTQWTFATNSKSYRNETNPLTLVFKGNMTKFSYSGEQSYTTVIFANSNQASVTYNPTGNTDNNNSNSHFYICANGTHSAMIENVSFSTDGFVHNAEKENTGVSYSNYFEKGYAKHICFCGSEFCDSEATLEPVFKNYGFSGPEYPTESYSLMQGFAVNRDMLKLLGEDVDYGVVADENAEGLAYKPAEEGAIVVSMLNESYDCFLIKIVSIPKEHLDTIIVCCGYVKVDGVIYYLNNGETSSSIIGSSYNDSLN